MGLTKYLPTIGRIFTPMAMLVFLTYEIVGSQTVTGGWKTAVLIGAGLTSIGVEVVGIMAGHTFEGYWRIGDRVRTAVSFFLLMVYMIAGIVILWHNSALLPIPIIATVVYLVSALAQSLEIEQEKSKTVDVARATFDLEEAKKDREHKRMLELKQIEEASQLKLAQSEQAAKIKLAQEQTKLALAQQEQKQAVAQRANSQAEAEQEQVECEDCGRVFGTVQALNAHQRFCSKKPIVMNGAVKK